MVLRVSLDRMRLCRIPRAHNGQTAVSQSSTEPENVSIDAWLRMEGIPALKLLDTVIDILHRQAGGDSKLVHQTQTPKHHDPFRDICDVPPNAWLFSMRTAVYIFKDHEVDLVMWARQEEEGQERRKVIKYMSERQEQFLAKDVTEEKARRSTDCITARAGRKSEARSQRN